MSAVPTWPAIPSSPGHELFVRINAVVGREMARSRTDGLSVERAIAVAMRELRPYLRNRFSIVNASSDDDRRRNILRLKTYDHAERRYVPADTLVRVFDEVTTPTGAS